MTTIVKTVAFDLQNMYDTLTNPTNYDDTAQHTSISHGRAFNKCHSILKKKATCVREGLTTLSNTSQSVLEQIDVSAKEQELTKLKQDYLQAQKEYNSILNNVESLTKKYVKRVDPSNPYLNKFIKFNGGQIGYVTNKGVVKLLSNVSDLAGTGVTFDPSTVIQLDFPIPANFSTPGTTIPTTPQLISGTPITIGKLLTHAGENVHVNKVLNNTSSSYVGCYVNNVNSPMAVLKTTSSDFASCKIDAINNGYKYFALQDNSTSQTLSCAATNDLESATMLGSSLKVQAETITWSTSINAGSGHIATLLNTGSLVIYNATNQVVYSTPGPNDNVHYLGCYADPQNSAMPNVLPGVRTLTQCFNVANQRKDKVYGIKDVLANGKGKCVTGSSKTTAQQKGSASNCIKRNENMYGGNLSNAVHSVSPGIDCYLIVMDNGNATINRGSGPQDDQGIIWSTSTANKIQDANPAFKASKGKYGKNWISVNDKLAAGDFVGSPSGTVALVMGENGNLKLKNWKMSSSCTETTGPTLGSGANALYKINQVGFPSNLGKYAYIDADSKLYSYPNNVLVPLQGVTPTEVNIDSVEYSKYAFGGTTIENTYGLAQITSVQREQLNQLATTLNLLSQQINTLNGQLQHNVTSVNNQLSTNSSAQKAYVHDIELNHNNETARHEMSTNIQNMLNDSNIVTLQKNYSYILLSILAAASILVAMNVIKNN